MNDGVLGTGFGAMRHILFGGFLFDCLLELLQDVVLLELRMRGHSRMMCKI